MDLRKLTVTPVADDAGRAGLTLTYWTKGRGDAAGGVYAVVPLDWEAYTTLKAKQAAELLASALENGLRTLIYLYDFPEEAGRLGIFEGVSDVDAEVARIRALREGDQRDD